MPLLPKLPSLVPQPLLVLVLVQLPPPLPLVVVAVVHLVVVAGAVLEVVVALAAPALVPRRAPRTWTPRWRVSCAQGTRLFCHR